jgi:class 3 adenylate cyclase/tetratricopeptide (TPR) repeat protein
MVTCPTCGAENADTAAFCSTCGTKLEAPARPTGREERKLVSVLFCDLVGFTDRSDRADPEDVREHLRGYHARLRADIERYGGTVEKFIGDAVMAVFGAPVAHEDDAERAVRSALRITTSIAELNEEDPARGLAVRVAVNTGEALVALDAKPELGEGLVVGDVVNTASRLQTVAPVNGVVVGEVTYRATRDAIDYEPLDPAQVKGKAEPIPIWRAVGARSRFGVDVEQATRVPFVGRTDELRSLAQAFDRATHEASVQLVTLTGEPGVGKTRLLWEFHRTIDERPDLITWRQGRCLAYGEGVTFWSVGEMLKAEAGVLESDEPDVAIAKLDRALDALGLAGEEHDWLRGRLAPLLGVGDASDAGNRDELFTAWRRFLEAIALRNPFVLVFEDLHWADPTMLAFVEHVVDWSTDVPMLVVCSARPELYELHPSWGGGKRNAATIALPPLTEQDTARLIGSLLEQAALPADVQAELLERAGGNPLYAEEFVRMLIDRGILERRGASLRIEVPEGGVPIPESVHALIEARLDTLPPDRKALLQDASIVGKIFWSGALAAMGEVDEREVRDGLHELARKELVRAVRSSSVRDQAEYSFWHALVRDVAYGQIPRAERGARHLAAAAWTERLAGDRVFDHAEFIAFHYERALELAAASGHPADPAVRASAARFLELAGDRSGALDVRKAADLYRRAEAALPEGDPHLPVLHVKTVGADADLGQATAEELASAFEAAIAHLKAVGELRAAGDMLERFSKMLRTAGDAERADRAIDDAIALLEPLGPSEELAAAYAGKAGNGMLAGRLDEWQGYTERALALDAELDLPRVRQRLLQYRGLIRIFRGDVEGLEDVREGLALGTELGLGHETAIAYTNLADWTCRTRDNEEGLRIYRQGMAFADGHGLGGIAMWMRAESTWPLFDLGRWDEVVATAAEVRGWFPGEELGTQAVMATNQEIHVLLWRGQVERAAELLRDAVPAARRVRDIQAIRPALTAAARLEASRGDVSAARAFLEELGAELDRTRFSRSYGMLDGVLIALQIGDVALAERLADPANVRFPQGKLMVATSRALVAEARGSHEEALASFDAAAAGWSKMRHVFQGAIAGLGAARCLAALGRSSDAAGRASAAAHTFEAVGARALSSEASALAHPASLAGS